MRSRATALLLLSGLALSLGACAGGHGKYTKEGISLAEERMSFMKSATEWDLARQAFLAGDLEKALDKVNGSIQINDQVVKSHVLKGRILIEMGELSGAIRSLNEAEAIDPQDPDTQYYLGVVFERLNRPQDALVHFKNACELDDYSASHAVAAAEMMIDLDRLDEARSYLLSIPMANDNAGIRQTLGQIALIENDTALAEKHLSDARLLAPDDQQILEQLVHAQLLNANYREAERNLDLLLSRFDNKDRRDLKLMHAQALVGTGRPVEARTLYQELISGKQGQSDIESWVGLGQTSLMVHDTRTARRAASRIVALSPNSSEGYVLWAMIHHDAGDIESASISINDAIDRNNTDAELFAFRAMIERDMGHADRALASANRAAQLDPDNPQYSRFASFLQKAVVATAPGADE